MANNALRFILALLVLVLGSAFEELLPKFLGVGFPVLLASVPLFATRSPAGLGVVFALAAGAAEDALSALPLLTSVSFFLLIGVLARWTRLRSQMLLFAFPVYQIWLTLWTPTFQGGFFGRLIISLPVGAVTQFAVAAILLAVERKAALDEVG